MELQANDLRIGNWIYYREEETCKVASIGYNFATENENTLQVGSDDINEYNPIPLTIEWLLKFGFAVQFDSVSIKNIFITFYEKRIECYFKDWAVGHLVKLRNIEYVHELQNLYYILHREELKLNKK